MKHLRRVSDSLQEASEPMFVLGDDGVIRDACGDLAEHAGWSRDELVGRSFEIMLSPEERHRAAELLDRCVRAGTVRDVKISLEDRKGGARPVLLSLSRMSGMIIAVVKDRGLLAWIEETLTHHAQLLGMHRDIADVVNSTDDLDTAIEYVLRRIAEFNGWQFGHAFLRSAEDPGLLVPVSAAYAASPEQYASFSEFTARTRWRRGEGLPGRVAEKGEPVITHDAAAELDDLRRRRAAELGLRSAFGFPVLIDHEVVGVLEFFSAESIKERTSLEFESLAAIGMQLGRVIERERSQRALREQALHLRHMTGRLRDAVWTYDPETRRTTYHNPAFETIWGLSAGILEDDAEAWLERVDPRDRERVATALRALREGRTLEEEFRLAAPDGEFPHWIRSRGFPIPEENGEVRSIVGTAEDVTARKREEQNRARMEREIRDAAEEERQRIARDLHDSLGSLLGAIHVRLEVLRSDVAEGRVPDREATEEISSLTQEAISRSRTLTRGLSPVGDDPYDLNAALKELVRGVGLHSGLDCRFVQSEPVRIDSRLAANQLYRIAQEALTNAVKHSGGGRVDVDLVEGEGEMRLIVEDDGRGFGANEGDPADAGVGLGIMEYRARDIGAELEVSSGSGACGVRLVCSWPAAGTESAPTGDAEET